MRSDVALYTIAGLFFVLALIAVVILAKTNSIETNRILFIASTVVLGVLSIGLRQYQKLKMKNNTKKTQTPPPVTANSTEPPKQPNTNPRKRRSINKAGIIKC